MSLLDLVADGHQKVLKVSGGCHNCPLKRVNFVPAQLNTGKVLWLGEVPGETEVSTQECFTGKSGEFLRAEAQRAGVPGPWSFSNTVHCRPPVDVAPKGKAVTCCLSQFVLDEVRDYPFVVLCGNLPLQAFFPGAKVDHFRGNFARHPDFPNQHFYTIYHPSYIFRRPDLKDEFYNQLNRLARVVQGEPPAAWTTVTGLAGLEALQKMVELPFLSLDLETSRLESWVVGGRIKSLAATADGKTVVVAHEDDPYFPAMLQLLAEFISKPEKSVCGSHIGFDLIWLERECGVRTQCALIHETGVQWYHAGQYKQPSLKELVSKELDGYRNLVHQPHETKDVAALLEYNAEDVVHPLNLLRKSMQILKPQTRDLVTRVLGPTEVILSRMTSHGFYLRQSYRQQKIDEYREKRRAVIAAWKAEDPEFIPDEHESGKGLLKYLFEIRRLPVLAKTEKDDTPSTDKSVLKQLVRDGYTVVQHLLDLREIDKIESTYLTAYDKFVWPDSRVRSHYPLTWTDSGRTSSRQPNVQNIPRKKEIRDLFGVPTGSVLLESDLSQIEFRIMVCLANDANGIAGYMRGEDAHTTTAKKAAGVDKPTKEQRSQAKPINFGFLYGAQWQMVQRLVADEYGVIWTDAEAARFREIFMTTYPALPVFHEDRKKALIRNRGWFESVVGHVFHYRDWDHPDSGKRDHSFRAALNSEAQGPAAQICFYIMVLARRMLDQRGFQSVEYVNTVHDSILTEIPNPAWVPDVVATINEAATLVHEWVKSWFIVPLIMEHSVGESWGSLQEFKE